VNINGVVVLLVLEQGKLWGLVFHVAALAACSYKLT
jgi:hypothetical protein